MIESKELTELVELALLRASVQGEIGQMLLGLLLRAGYVIAKVDK